MNIEHQQQQQEEEEEGGGGGEEKEEYHGYKKKKRSEETFTTLYLSHLPDAQMYEYSYMHRDIVTHTLVTPETDFIITASQDGQIKFWKKSLGDIEFVKHFVAHLDVPVTGLTCSRDGQLVVSCSQFDKTAKIFDVINFDMINVLKFDFVPTSICLIHKRGSARPLLAVSELNRIHIYDPLSTAEIKKSHFSKEIHKKDMIGFGNNGGDDGNGGIGGDNDGGNDGGNDGDNDGDLDNDKRDDMIGDNHDNGVMVAKIISTLEKMHYGNITLMKYNEPFNVVISCDDKGMIKYWSAEEPNFERLPNERKLFDKGGKEQKSQYQLLFKLAIETDLYEFFKKKTQIQSLEICRDGTKFVCMGMDRQIRIFDFRSGKLTRVYDEGLDMTANKFQQLPIYRLDNIDFGRRFTIEKEIEKAYEKGYTSVQTSAGTTKYLSPPPPSNVIFDESGTFIIYPTLHGIKIVNTIENKVDRLLGKVENTERFLGISLFQGTVKMRRAQLAKLSEKKKKIQTFSAATLLPNQELQSFSNSDKPIETLAQQVASHLQSIDPTIFCCAYKKSRFYLFSKREPSEDSGSNDPTAQGRDIFNEKPSKDDIEQHALMSTTLQSQRRLGKYAVIHTTLGDIHIRLFGDKCPKAVENFTIHSMNGYYNKHLFHRVIKNFMVQTGDPEGDGTGGKSIWGGDFADEFHPHLRHNKPFKVSMANSGPNSNGSQFFITTVPTPWLDDKHTLFGEVFKGQEVVQAIENVRTNRDDKPLEDTSIINIEIMF